MRNDIVESKTPSSSSPSSGGPASEPVNNEPLWRRIGAALFYGMASLAIMLINKQVLTVYHFKSPLVRIYFNTLWAVRARSSWTLNNDISLFFSFSDWVK